MVMFRPHFTPTAFALTAFLSACATTPANFTYQPFAQPEGESGVAENPGWAVRKFAVAAASPLATDAGYEVLKAGGSAVDLGQAVRACHRVG